MSLKIGTYLFTGPFDIDKAVVRKNKAAAIYAIVCRAGEPWNPTFRVLAFGESGDEGLTFAEHPNRCRWEADNDGELGVYLLTGTDNHVFSTEERLSIVTELQTQYPPHNANIPISGM